ncbi:Imm61 family immunity protein [Mycobacterium sp. AT1]|uniref:Imm61 family immunity protein n=1 Tax=Mycobacterium sp. AT1 TaxID=1961706 RepID=UPI001E49C67A|nr:Imm61 family immunity protein [Mycobacterium sp. AT1]
MTEASGLASLYYRGWVRSDVFSLTAECVRWAQLARYDWNPAAWVLRRPGEDGYAVVARPAGRAELLELVDDGTRERVLYAADGAVLERFMVGLLGDDIRDDLDLPFLTLPSAAADIADGYRLGPSANGSRTLFRGVEPVAAAPGESTSVAALVPLSHFVGHTVEELRRSYLSERGEPLLSAGRYAGR